MLAVLDRNGVYLTGFDLYSLALLMLESVATTPTACACRQAAESAWQTICGANDTVPGDRTLATSLLITAIYNLFTFPYTAMVA